MTIEDAFHTLRSHFQTDRACANHIGLSPQHFEALRNGRAKINKRTADLIILKAMAVHKYPTPTEAPDA